jgi:predicted RNA polymerase sigma factor
MSASAAGKIEEVFRREAGRVLATLIRLLGDFDLAEEAQQDAFAAAIEQWPAQGMPDNPRAWLISAGRNKAIDRIRREVFFREKIFDRELAAAQRDGSRVATRRSMMRRRLHSLCAKYAGCPRKPWRVPF